MAQGHELWRVQPRHWKPTDGKDGFVGKKECDRGSSSSVRDLSLQETGAEKADTAADSTPDQRLATGYLIEPENANEI